MHIDLYGFPGSTYTRSARIACVEKGIAYTLHPLDFGSASHLALHPFGKMPAMRHGEIALFEAAAIAYYVDEIGDGPSLQPDTAADRAGMWRWVSAGIDYFYDAFVRSLLNHGDGSGPPNEAAAESGTCWDVLEAALRHSAYLAGSTLSLADLIVGPMVAYYANSNRGASLDKASAASTWLQALEARESFKATA